MTRSYVKAAQGTITYQKFYLENESVYKAGYFVAYITLDGSITQRTIVHALHQPVKGI